jgi:hypothetical protein
MIRLSLILAVAAYAIDACATTQQPPPEVTGIRLEIEPTDAELTVDGQNMGPLTEVPLTTDGVLKLPPGLHQLVLKKKGFQTWRGEVSLGNTVEPLKVSLVKTK